jgi:hypothetical protein
MYRAEEKMVKNRSIVSEIAMQTTETEGDSPASKPVTATKKQIKA